MCMRSRERMRVYMQTSEVDMLLSSIALSPSFFLRQGLSLSPELVGSASLATGSTHLHLPGAVFIRGWDPDWQAWTL